jgi:hypothetical protein
MVIRVRENEEIVMPKDFGLNNTKNKGKKAATLIDAESGPSTKAEGSIFILIIIQFGSVNHFYFFLKSDHF